MGERKIIKQKTKNFSTMFLLILLSSIVYATVISNVQAAEVDASQKTITALSEIVGLNTNTYTTSLNRDSTSTFLGLNREEVNLNFASDKSSLRAKCIFLNNELQQIYLSDYTGELALKQPTTSILDMAKGFMERYSRYAGDPFYDKLSLMMNDIKADENVTKITDNVKFEVSILGDQTHIDLTWTFVDDNNIPALAKNVVLSYDRGLLQGFMNNWQFYKITGIPKLFSEDAQAIALKAIQDFSYDAIDADGKNITVSGFKVISVGEATLSYINYNEQTAGCSARGGDPFALYPSWYISLGFEKLYPGSVTGARIRIWADTNEVSSIDPMIYGRAIPSSDNIAVSEATILEAVSTGLVATALISGIAGVSIYRLKTPILKQKRSLKTIFITISIPVFCILISSSLLITAVPNANATKKAELYASTYGQAGNEPYYAAVVLNNIWYYYQSVGVAVTNNYGSGTTENAIFANINNDEINYDGVTIFHFGHMAGANNYLDSSGATVTYGEIDTATSNNRHYFVWLWACNQANGPSVGMPPAWTHVTTMSNNALLIPDNTDHCFIGFSGGSPALGYRSFEGYTQLAHPFITNFYNYAVTQSYTVANALQQSSYDLFGCSYYQSPLYEGYRTWWPWNPLWPDIAEGWYNGDMQVYGDPYVVP